ncbi:MAG: hypothetical protein CMB80_02300 [Flammeovirgaceae bacterium]|nr:hypothetical protein [Flammeovirgaceae bacterium]|tara:strand:+ start:141 stop:515 length:375 start_codon:yes stop_codon:yes gene_type:complete
MVTEPQVVVKMKGIEVGKVDIPVFESLEEIIENGIDETAIIKKFNKMNKIDIMNAERNKHREGKVGKQKRNRIAFNLLTTEEAQRFIGNYDGLQAFLESPEMQKRVDNDLASTTAPETAEAIAD